MGKRKYLRIILLIILSASYSFIAAQVKPLVRSNFEFAEYQYSNMLKIIDGDSSKDNPGFANADHKLQLVPSGNWISGFFPGCLWYIYEYTNDSKWEIAAEKFTANEEKEQYNSTTHDIGFKIDCSYGNGYNLTSNKQYDKIIIQSAKTLSTRFNPIVGCIRSWDHYNDDWQYPVIIDNMMNLELLFRATQLTGDSSYYKIAVSHANKTMKNHFRKDYSTWHVVNYDSVTGKVISKVTHQGYSNNSCWARGESWALYGYTMCYRYTKDPKYLKQAQHIAHYILTNKNLPKDMIPYWDYNAPNIPNAKRDASAAAIMCSAFYELSTYSGKLGAEYKKAADTILESLSSPKYLAKRNKNGDFLLMHSVGNMPANSQVDVPIIYADYYFLEANLRKLKIKENE
jgi:unsaturated chondroitin disaccharide hydrolase